MIYDFQLPGHRIGVIYVPGVINHIVLSTFDGLIKWCSCVYTTQLLPTNVNVKLAAVFSHCAIAFGHTSPIGFAVCETTTFVTGDVTGFGLV